MKISVKHVLLFGSLCCVSAAYAGTGVFMSGYGTASKGMGGVGTAVPLSVTDAVAFNPAGLTRFDGFSAEIAAAGIFSDVNAKVNAPVSASGDDKYGPFVLPAVALGYQVGDLYLGLGAMAYGGLGVDYKNTALKAFGAAPPANGDINTFFGNFKISPSAAYKMSDTTSIGVSFDINANQLDLGVGNSTGYAYGISAGITHKLTNAVSLGLAYTSKQGTKMKRVIWDGTNYSDLDFAMPEVVRAGIAFAPTKDLLVGLDYKWLNNAKAEGLKDFDWRNTTVLSLGIQYALGSDTMLRAGFNVSHNPVKEHNGWNPAGVTQLQGTAIPTASYEYLRLAGLPLFVKRNFSLGFEKAINKNVSLSMAYEQAPKNSRSSASAGNVFNYEASLAQKFLTIGLGFRY